MKIAIASQIAAQRQLVAGEQRSGRNREILFAGGASTGSVVRRSGAGSRKHQRRRSYGHTGLAIRFGPAHVPETFFGFRVAHADDLGQGQGLSGLGRVRNVGP